MTDDRNRERTETNSKSDDTGLSVVQRGENFVLEVAQRLIERTKRAVRRLFK